MKIIYFLIFVLTLSSARANIENCGITNKLLKEKNLGTFLQPTSSKITSIKDSKEYTRELQLLNIQKRKKFDEFLENKKKENNKETKESKRLDHRQVREEFGGSDFVKKFIKDVEKINRKSAIPGNQIPLHILYI